MPQNSLYSPNEPITIGGITIVPITEDPSARGSRILHDDTRKSARGPHHSFFLYLWRRYVHNARKAGKTISPEWRTASGFISWLQQFPLELLKSKQYLIKQLNPHDPVYGPNSVYLIPKSVAGLFKKEIRKKDRKTLPGVVKRKNGWQARYTENNETTYLPIYRTQEEAHAVYLNHRLKRLNEVTRDLLAGNLLPGGVKPDHSLMESLDDLVSRRTRELTNLLPTLGTMLENETNSTDFPTLENEEDNQ